MEKSEQERIVVCPNDSCKAVLKIVYQEGMEKKKIRCSLCGQVYPFTMFANYRKTSVDMPDEDKTQISSYSKQRNIGSLLLPGESEPQELHVGRNIVGRESASSPADIQVPDPEGRCRMSRSHFVIEVVKRGDNVRHLMSLCTDGKKNKTSVNNVELKAGDVVVLHNGDRITVDYQTISFMLGEAEETMLNL